MSLTFKSFEAASRKRNMAAFGMFPADRSLTWIANTEDSPFPYTVAFSATPVFDLANGNLQRITLTGNVTSSTFVLNGGSFIPDGTQFYLHVLQDATGGRTFALPASVRNPAAFAVGADAGVLTSFQFEYRSGGWDIAVAPVEPAVPPVTVTFSTTPVFELADGLIQRITITADVASSTFVYNGSSTIADGTQFYLRILQDGTGGWLFQWPTAVRNPGSMVVNVEANVMTSFFLEYRNSGWDLSQVPVKGVVV